MYNPVGTHLPPSQASLEADYRLRLDQDFDIQFNQLLTITNMPIKRFEHALLRDQQYDAYMQQLFDNFNADAAQGIMCRELISVGWDGQLYDCDFNQMLDMPIDSHANIWQIDRFTSLNLSPIATAKHCYGCTAGSGSSCSGATV